MSLWGANKRLLALDGGGVRGIVTIAFLERIEAMLKVKSGKDDFRLTDHFHLIGGTSTGAIIAAALAIGRTVDEIKTLYLDLAPRVFRRSWSRVPWFQPKFLSRPLAEILAKEFGDLSMDDPLIRTLVAIVMKRVDTGSPWIVSNLPGQPYWNDRADGKRPGNRHFKLADLVRASTAAPSYFGPERVPITTDVVGNFIDGGVSPYNCPVIPLLMLASMRSYGLCWPLGAESLSMISIGTGRRRQKISAAWKPALVFAARTLEGLIEDGQATSLMLMQWLSEPQAPWLLNRDIGTLSGDCLTERPLLSFQRYDLLLEKEWLEGQFDREFGDREIKQLQRIDDPSAMGDLYALAKQAAESQVSIQ